MCNTPNDTFQHVFLFNFSERENFQQNHTQNVKYCIMKIKNLCQIYEIYANCIERENRKFVWTEIIMKIELWSVCWKIIFQMQILKFLTQIYDGVVSLIESTWVLMKKLLWLKFLYSLHHNPRKMALKSLKWLKWFFHVATEITKKRCCSSREFHQKNEIKVFGCLVITHREEIEEKKMMNHFNKSIKCLKMKTQSENVVFVMIVILKVELYEK